MLHHCIRTSGHTRVPQDGILCVKNTLCPQQQCCSRHFRISKTNSARLDRKDAATPRDAAISNHWDVVRWWVRDWVVYCTSETDCAKDMKRHEKLCLVLLGLCFKCFNVKEFSWSIFKFNPCYTLPARYRLMIDKLIPSNAETLEVQPVTGHERLHSDAKIHSGTSHLWACSPPQAFLRRLILRRASHDFT